MDTRKWDAEEVAAAIQDRMEAGHGGPASDTLRNERNNLVLVMPDGSAWEVILHPTDVREPFTIAVRGESFEVEPGESDEWFYEHRDRGGFNTTWGTRAEAEQEAREWAERWLADAEAKGEWSEADGWADEREPHSDQDLLQS